MTILHTLPPAAQEGIIESLTAEDHQYYNVRSHRLVSAAPQPVRPSPRPRPGSQRFQGDLGAPEQPIANVPDSTWQPPQSGTER